MDAKQLRRAEELAKKQGGLIMPAPADTSKLQLPPARRSEPCLLSPQDEAKIYGTAEPKFAEQYAEEFQTPKGRFIRHGFVQPGRKLGERPQIRTETVSFFGYEDRGTAEDLERERLRLSTLWPKLQADDDISYFRDMQGKRYLPAQQTSRGYTTIPVLEFLNGQPLNNLVLAYVNGLHPSKIRVTGGGCTTDSCCDRVTIFYEEKDGQRFVARIEQEIEVLYACGYDIDCMLRYQTKGTPLPENHPRCVGHTAALAKADFH